MVAKPTRDWWKKDTTRWRTGLVRSRGALLGVAAAAILIVMIASGMFAGNGSENSNVGPDSPNEMTASMSAPQPSFGMGGRLENVKQENENLPKFKNSVDTTIDVADGGQLFLRTNLGTIDVSTHDKPTVELRLVHTVAAKDKETAGKLFQALKIDYGLDTDVTRNAGLTKGYR